MRTSRIIYNNIQEETNSKLKQSIILKFDETYKIGLTGIQIVFDNIPFLLVNKRA